MKGFTSKVKKIALVTSFPILFYASCFGLNNLFFNRAYIGVNNHSVTRTDGAFSHTELSRYHSDSYQHDEVHQFRLFGTTRFISDGGLDVENDGLVDKIYISGPMFSRVSRELTREIHYKKFKEEFDNAGKILAETKKRFEGHF